MIIQMSFLVRPATPAGPGEIGSRSPAVWRHFVRTQDGKWLLGELLSDSDNPADYQALSSHIESHPQKWNQLLTIDTP